MPMSAVRTPSISSYPSGGFLVLVVRILGMVEDVKHTTGLSAPNGLPDRSRASLVSNAPFGAFNALVVVYNQTTTALGLFCAQLSQNHTLDSLFPTALCLILSFSDSDRFLHARTALQSQSGTLNVSKTRQLGPCQHGHRRSNSTYSFCAVEHI